MSYQVLARKWRPRNFTSLVGQEHVVRALAHALEEKRLHHAYLFTGTRGVGKTTIARILAKSLNCETGITQSPCGQCQTCREIDAGRFVDLLEVDAATNTRVDEMRQLLENAIYAPTRGRFKVYVIDEVHMLSTSAFNAMLKTLEEPPEHVKFILATTDPQKIPVTVLSRCLQFNLKQMSELSITRHLAQILEAEGVAFDQASLALIARAAAGSMRDALSLLDQSIAHGAGKLEESMVRAMLGVVGNEYTLAIAEELLNGHAEGLNRLAAEISVRSLSFASTLQELAGLFTRLQLAKLAPASLDETDPDYPRLSQLAQRFSNEFLQLAYQIAVHGRQELSLAPDEFSGFLMTLLRLYTFRPERVSDVVSLAASQAVDRRPVSSPAAGRPEPSPPAVSEEKAADASPPRAARAAEVPVPNPVADGSVSWSALVESLAVSGLARELALNSQLVRLEEGLCVLAVAATHNHLKLTGAEKLQAALTAHFARPIQLRLDSAGGDVATPAQAQQQVRRNQMRDAVAAIENDRFVCDATDVLEARVVDASIKPLVD